MSKNNPTSNLLARVPSLGEMLRVSRDICTSIGAFFVTATGELGTTLPDTAQAQITKHRFEALAEGCLTHPGAGNRATFATAEITDEADAIEHSFACLALPIWSGDVRLGVLGVVDIWLPELTDEQRTGLMTLGDDLSEELTSIGAVEAVQAYDRRRHNTVTKGSAPADSASGPEATATDVTATPKTSGQELVRFGNLETAAAASQAARHESFLGEVLDHLPDGLLVTRADGAVVMVNQAVAKMTGLPVNDLLGANAAQIVSTGEVVAEGAVAPSSAEQQAMLLAALGRAQSGRNLLVSSTSGDPVVTEPSGSRMLSRYAGECTVTLLRRTAEAPRGAHNPSDKPAAVLDELEDGVICCDQDGIVLVANAAARVLHGLPADAVLVGLPFSGVTGLQSFTGLPLDPDSHPLLQALEDGTTHNIHLYLSAGGEHQRHLAVSARPLQLDNGERGAIAVLRDITAEWTEQEQLAHFALHDPLTGLANRYLFAAELDRMLTGVGRRGGSVWLVFLDLDDFKAVNDEHGHTVGDELLTAIGRRLAGAVRSDDVVARLGGDEFVIAHTSTSPLFDEDRLVARIRKALLAPYRVDGKVFDVKISLGSVSTASTGVSPEQLLDEADKAMYDEKRRRVIEA